MQLTVSGRGGGAHSSLAATAKDAFMTILVRAGRSSTRWPFLFGESRQHASEMCQQSSTEQQRWGTIKHGRVCSQRSSPCHLWHSLWLFCSRRSQPLSLHGPDAEAAAQKKKSPSGADLVASRPVPASRNRCNENWEPATASIQ